MTATPEQQRDFLAASMNRALARLDDLPLDTFFDDVEADEPKAKCLMWMADELRSSLNVLGLDNHTNAANRA